MTKNRIACLELEPLEPNMDAPSIRLEYSAMSFSARFTAFDMRTSFRADVVAVSATWMMFTINHLSRPNLEPGAVQLGLCAICFNCDRVKFDILPVIGN